MGTFLFIFCFILFFILLLEQYVIIMEYRIVMGEDIHVTDYLKFRDFEMVFLCKSMPLKSFETNRNHNIPKGYFSYDCSHFSLRVLCMPGLDIMNGTMFLLEKFSKHFFRKMILMFSLHKRPLYSFLSFYKLS
jgi:hypothetical protein